MNDIINYLPDFMQRYREINEICSAIQTVLSNIGNAADNIVKNVFIADCDEDTLARFENLLGIVVYPDDTLSVRRERVLLQWSLPTVYNYQSLLRVIQSVCGNEYIITCDNVNYEISLQVYFTNSRQIQELNNAIDRMLPMNFVYNISNCFSREISGNTYFNSVCTSMKFVTVNQTT